MPGDEPSSSECACQSFVAREVERLQGGQVAPARDEEALRQLKEDPAGFFRRTRRQLR